MGSLTCPSMHRHRTTLFKVILTDRAASNNSIVGFELTHIMMILKPRPKKKKKKRSNPLGHDSLGAETPIVVFYYTHEDTEDLLFITPRGCT